MILPDHLRTAQQILHRAGLEVGDGRRTAAALIAVHLANLPPEPEMWGAPEPMSSEGHMREAVLSACRVVKAVGWVPDAMTVALLACAHSEATHAGHVWLTQMNRNMRRAEELRDLAGVATVATEHEAAPVVHTYECYTRSAMAERWTCACSGTMADYRDDTPAADRGLDPMAPILDEVERVASETPPIVVEVAPEHAMSVAIEEFPTAAESRGIANALIDVILDSHGLERGPDGVTAAPEPTPEPAPKKPRCGLAYTHREIEADGTTLNETDRACSRPEGHNGKCGPAKVVGKAKAAEVGS